MKPMVKKQLRRQRRKRHVRKHLTGTPERPRLTVFRSHRYIYAQIIDDSAGRTLVAASSLDKATKKKLADVTGGQASAEVVGTTLAAKAVKAGIEKVVFDRNGYPYHGRVQKLAEAVRKGGLKF